MSYPRWPMSALNTAIALKWRVWCVWFSICGRLRWQLSKLKCGGVVATKTAEKLAAYCWSMSSILARSSLMYSPLFRSRCAFSFRWIICWICWPSEISWRVCQLRSWSLPEPLSEPLLWLDCGQLDKYAVRNADNFDSSKNLTIKRKQESPRLQRLAKRAVQLRSQMSTALANVWCSARNVTTLQSKKTAI